MRLSVRRSALSTLVAIGLISCIDGPTTPRPAVLGSHATLDVTAPPVVISQVYGGGGNSGANWRNDYVELFNTTTGPVDVSGWKVQYTSAAGNTWSSNSVTIPASTTIASGKYYLIQLASNAAVGSVLPSPDFSPNTINMSGTTGKVILTNGANGSGNCPKGGAVIDYVGYGTSTNCTAATDWGSSATGNLTNTTAATRKGAGCTYTGVLSADFTSATAAPRNSATTAAPCTIVVGPLHHIVVTGTMAVNVGSTTALSIALKDANNNTITDNAATYTAVSTDETTAHVESITGNTVTIRGLQPSTSPVEIDITATSNGVGPVAANPQPAITVNPAASITPSTTFVSEIHYDNSGTDTGEAIEIEGDAGSSLDGWSLVLYNGSAGTLTPGVYSTTPLSGTIPATCGARGVVVVNFPVNGIQNGDADGWALVNAQGQVTELQSYEGTFTAVGGPAAGLTSTAIGADESVAPPAGRSVQRAGNGVWFGPNTSTFGACNPPLPLGPEGTITLTSGKTSLAFAMQTQFFFGGVDLSGNPPAASKIVWSTDDASIITVDQKGIVTAKGLGTAKLVVTDTADGSFGKVSINVYLAAGSTGIRLGHNTEFGEPADNNPSDDKIIRRAQYTVSYNPARGGANWVSWNLDASHIGDNGRCPGTCYSADTALANFTPAITAYTTADWVSGNTYDRGHMAPSADWTSSEADNNTTFFLTNFLPQTHALNAGPWEVLENALRDSVSVAHGSREAYIIAGGIFSPGSTLGMLNGKIAIPDSTWKIVVITPSSTGLNADGTLPAHTTVLAFNMPNVTNPNPDPFFYSNTGIHPTTSIAKIEQSTGYNFLALIAESVQCQVEQRNCAPTARQTSDVVGGHVIVGQHINFSGATSSDPDEGDALSYAWSINGSPAGTGATFNHEFLATGTYQVRLTVTDLGGLTSSADASVIVDPRPEPSCGTGRFENAADDYNCDPAPAGTYVAVTNAIAPTPCAVGTYQPLAGQSSCLNATAGHYVASPGSQSQTDCAVGFYQPNSAAANCVASPAGSFVGVTAAIAATLCPAGHFQNQTGASDCIATPAGSYASNEGSTSATPCDPGYYQPNQGQISCIAAPAGSYVSGPAATVATPCPAGSFQNATASVACISAPAGTFVNSLGATAATPCAAGTFQSLTGATSCDLAPAGSYVATQGAVAATSCAPGYYQPNFGQISCIAAPAGSYVPTQGAAAATPCPAGYYQPGTAASACIAAPVGSYVDVIGATSATPCPIGMTTNSTATTSPAGCVWLPPAQLTQLVTDQLNALVTNGALSSGDASPIQVSIDQAQASIARGNLTAAKNQLGATRNKVQAAVNSGKLTAAQAADLLAAIDRAVAHM